MGVAALIRFRLSRGRYQVPYRPWSSSSAVLSGHNRWSKIRHDKARNDEIKSRERSILSSNIILASKIGGPDPKLNSQLALAITNAKRGQLAKQHIEAAIAKGQGKSLSGAALEYVSFEAIFPPRIAVIIECQTDHKLRTLQEIPYLVKKCGGTVTPTAFMFERIGKIFFERQDRLTVDDAFDDAIEAGALDIIEEDGKIVVDTNPTEVFTIAKRLQDRFDVRAEKSEIVFVPNEDNLVVLNEEQGVQMERFLEKLEENPDFQNMYINVH